MSQLKQRSLIRTLHLVGSGLIGWALYGHSGFALTIAQWAVFPALVLSGLWMWKQGAIVRWLKNSATSNQKEGKE